MIKISTRLVFIFPKIVLKFPLSFRGFLQSKNEKYLFDKYAPNDYLGKLYWEKFGVVCMKKYKKCKEIPSEKVFEIKQIIPELNIKNCDLHNCKNWGLNKDVYILLDYGINEEISKMY
jgi:hypothetical protein